MKIFINKIVRIFLFCLLSSSTLYVLYGLTLNYSLNRFHYNNITQYTLGFIFLIGFILSVFFNKSKVFLLLLLFLFIYILASPVFFDKIIKQIEYTTSYSPLMIFLFLFYILLFNIIIINLYKERGIFTGRGLRRIFFILIQIYLLYLLVYKNFLLNDIRNYFTDLHLQISAFTDLYYFDNILVFLFILSFLSILLNLNYAEDYAFLFIIINIFVLFFYLGSYQDFLLTVFTFLSVLFLDIAIIKDSYSMAYLDELTGLPGRRALEEEILKLGNQYSIGMLDIDHFKKFNDKYGHDIGDEVLKMVASRMRKTKGGAKVYRYGGEEFTIVFSRKRVGKAYLYLEQLRKDIADTPFIIRNKDRPKKKAKKRRKNRKNKKRKKPVTGEKVKITVSIGVAEKTEKHKNANEVIKEADKALYKAKNKGRNCVLS